MKLLLCSMLTLVTFAFGNPTDLEFKRTAQTENMKSFQTIDFSNNDQAQEKRAFPRFLCGGRDTCQSGYVNSKYCTVPAPRCFGNGQNVYVRFSKPYRTVPKVTIGLTLVDTSKHDNVRVRVSVTSVTKQGFNILFRPWTSHTYQVGVNWLACP